MLAQLREYSFLPQELFLTNTVGPRTERILGQEKTRSAQNRSDWGQGFILECKYMKEIVQMEVRVI